MLVNVGKEQCAAGGFAGGGCDAICDAYAESVFDRDTCEFELGFNDYDR